jgi:hypothetical protein
MLLRSGALPVLLALVLGCGPRNHAPDVPAAPLGPAYGLQDSTYEFRARAYDPDGDSVALQVAWGYAPLSDWSGVIGSDGQAVWIRSWPAPGDYAVRVRARDTKGAVSDWSPALDVGIVSTAGLPLSPLAPLGPDSVGVGFIEEFSFPTRGPPGESLVLTFDWGDSRIYDWWEVPCAAGETVRIRQSFPNEGDWYVRAMAREGRAETYSPWSAGHRTKVRDSPGSGWAKTLDLFTVGSLSPTVNGGLVAFGESGQGLALVEADGAGNPLWMRSYGWLTLGDIAMSVRQTSDGGYIVVGTSFGSFAFAWAFLGRVSSGGDLTWQKSYFPGDGEIQGPYGRCIRPTLDGGYILAAGTVLMKTDSCGDSVWAKLCSANSVEVSPDGGYVVAGFRNGASLLKTDSLGNTQWERSYAGPDAAAGTVRLLPDGGFVLAGGVYPTDGSGMAYLAKVNADGSLAWEREYGGIFDTEIWDVALSRDGGYFLVGWTNLDYDPYVYVARVDAAGNLKWHRLLNRNGGHASSALPTPDNGCIIGVDEQDAGPSLFKVDENGGIGPVGYEAGLSLGAGVRGGPRSAQLARARRPLSVMRERLNTNSQSQGRGGSVSSARVPPSSDQGYSSLSVMTQE